MLHGCNAESIYHISIDITTQFFVVLIKLLFISEDTVKFSNFSILLKIHGCLQYSAYAVEADLMTSS